MKFIIILIILFYHFLGRKKNTASSPMVGCRSHSHVSAATGTSTCPRAGQWSRLTATSGSTSTSAWGLMEKSSPVPSPLVLSLSIITLGWTSRRFLSEFDVTISTQTYLMFSKNWAPLALWIRGYFVVKLPFLICIYRWSQYLKTDRRAA